MGLSSSKDEVIRGEIGCDSIGTMQCSETSSLMCFEGICALFIAETEKRCVERCKCYPGYFGEYCQFRDSSIFATAGIVGGIIGIFLLIFLGSLIWCCWYLTCHSRRKRHRLNQEWEREQNNPTDIESNPHLSNAPNQRSQSEHLADRPRSGYYEHELCGDMDNGNNGNDSAVNIDRMETAENPDSTRETSHLLAYDETDHQAMEISIKPPSSHQETSASPG
uniref:Epidermal growth factor n=1 Tax=Echinococcus granulosus TaxID=6210 RepID=A0A068WIB1_ECHGR|nr:epidermal growth factor [Echinococcus granulosus]